MAAPKRVTVYFEPGLHMTLRLKAAQTERSVSDLVNTAVRLGLQQMIAPPARSERYRTRSVDLGRCLVGDVDDVAGALAAAEGEHFR